MSHPLAKGNLGNLRAIALLVNFMLRVVILLTKTKCMLQFVGIIFFLGGGGECLLPVLKAVTCGDYSQ